MILAIKILTIVLFILIALFGFLHMLRMWFVYRRRVAAINIAKSTKPYVSPKIEVRNGRIGRGCFAVSPIRKGEMIVNSAGGKPGYYSGKEVRRFTSDPAYWHYVFQIHDDVYYVPLNGPVERDFINHSCDPNCGIQGLMTYIALRDIAAGEEITNDYSMSESMGCWIMPCECGSAQCRKVITGNDWENKRLQQKYNGYFSEYLQRKFYRRAAHKVLLDIYWCAHNMVQALLSRIKG